MNSPFSISPYSQKSLSQSSPQYSCTSCSNSSGVMSGLGEKPAMPEEGLHQQVSGIPLPLLPFPPTILFNSSLVNISSIDKSLKLIFFIILKKLSNDILLLQDILGGLLQLAFCLPEIVCNRLGHSFFLEKVF